MGSKRENKCKIGKSYGRTGMIGIEKDLVGE
jgi:hypothetical protein